MIYIWADTAASTVLHRVGLLPGIAEELAFARLKVQFAAAPAGDLLSPVPGRPLVRIPPQEPEDRLHQRCDRRVEAAAIQRVLDRYIYIYPSSSSEAKLTTSAQRVNSTLGAPSPRSRRNRSPPTSRSRTKSPTARSRPRRRRSSGTWSTTRSTATTSARSRRSRGVRRPWRCL